MLGVRGVVLRGHRKVFQRHEHHAVALADDVAVDDVHIVDRLTGELCRVLKNFLPQERRRLADGEARDVGLAARVSAEACGRDVRILT